MLKQNNMTYPYVHPKTEIRKLNRVKLEYTAEAIKRRIVTSITTTTEISPLDLMVACRLIDAAAACNLSTRCDNLLFVPEGQFNSK